MKIEELFIKKTKPEVRKRRAGIIVSSSNIPVYKEFELKIADFENKVFKFLLENKQSLGLKEFYSLKNIIVDSVLELDDEKILLCEFKFALNWFTCSTARTEIQRFTHKSFLMLFPQTKSPIEP